jgi:separase
MIGCWNCLFIKSLYSCSIQNILQFRVNCVRRRYLLPLLLKRGPLFLVYVLCYMCSCGIIISHEGYHLAWIRSINHTLGYVVYLFIHIVARFLVFPSAARALGAHGGRHEVHNVYWQCISLLYFKSLPEGCYSTYGPHLISLIMNGNIDDYLPLERAEILHSLSFFSLIKGSLPEQSRLFHWLPIMRDFLVVPVYNTFWIVCIMSPSAVMTAVSSLLLECLVWFPGCWKLLFYLEKAHHFFRRCVISFNLVVL